MAQLYLSGRAYLADDIRGSVSNAHLDFNLLNSPTFGNTTLLSTASPNCSRTSPGGTPAIWKRPDWSATADRLVPTTVTLRPEAVSRVEKDGKVGSIVLDPPDRSTTPAIVARRSPGDCAEADGANCVEADGEVGDPGWAGPPHAPAPSNVALCDNE